MEPNYSPEELDKFITMGAQFAAKSVLAVLCETIMWAGGSDDAKVTAEQLVGDASSQTSAATKEAATLCDEVTSRTPYKHAGHTRIEMAETDWELVVSLTMCPADYRMQIDLPSYDYSQQLFTQCTALRRIARAYWATFREKYPELIERIAKFCNMDIAGGFREFIAPGEEAGSTLGWHEEVPRRVGVFCYYVDGAGRPMVRRVPVDDSESGGVVVDAATKK